MTGVVDPKLEAEARARHAEVRAAFLRCRELGGREREAALAGLDARVRREVGELLAADAREHDALADEHIDGRDPLAPWIATAAQAVEPVPERIAGFRVLRRLGAGGMGIVYEAEQEAPRRRVALKLVRPGLAHGERLKRFRLEAEALGRLQHPGIAQIFDFGTCDLGHGEQPFFVMELVEGRPLLAHAAEARLDRRARLALVAELCDAVQHAHERGVVHRDLKPDNVLVDGAGHAKVLDFGVARVRSDAVPLTTIHTAQGQIVGTLTHMAPEQLTGDPDAVGPAADVYALGVIAFELLSGRLPHEVAGLTFTQAVRQITEVEPPRLGTLDRGLRGDLETIVAKALDADPSRRYVSPAALAADLRRHLAHEPIAARPPGLLYRASKYARRHPGRVGVLVALAVGALVSTLFAFDARRERDAAERQAYRAALEAALATLDGDSANVPLGHLAGAPERLRGWEWRHLSSRLEPTWKPLGDALAPLTALGVGHASPLVAVAHGGEGAARLHVLSAADGSLVGEGELPLARALELAFQDGDRTLVVLGARADGALHAVQWDWPRGTALRDVSLGIGAAGLWGQALSLHGERAALGFGAPGPATDEDMARIGARRVTLVVSTEDGARLRELPPLFSPSLSFGDGGRLLGGIGDMGAWLSADRGSTAFDVLDLDSGALVLSAPSSHGCLASGSPLALIRRPSLDVEVLELASETRVLGRERIPLDERAAFTAFSPDATRVLSLQQGTLHLWDVAAGKRLGPFARVPGEIRALRFLPGGERFVTATWQGEVRTWPMDTRGATVLEGHESFVYALALSPAGDLLASGGWDGYGGQGKSLRLWDPESGVQLAGAGEPGNWLEGGLIWTRDGRDLFSGWSRVGGGVVLCTEVATGTRRWSAEFERPAYAMALDPREARLFVTARGGELVALSTADGHRLASRDIGWTGNKASSAVLGSWEYPYPVAILGERRIAVAGPNFTLELCDADTLAPVASWPAHADAIAALAASEDGRLLLSASEDGTVRQWDVATGSEARPALAHEVGVLCAAYQPGGERLATGARDGVVRIFEPRTGTELVRLAGHGAYVIDLEWSADGETLFSASGDGTIRVWGTRPLRERIAAREELTALGARLAPEVDALVDAAEGEGLAPDEVRARLEQTFASARERRVAIQLAVARRWSRGRASER